MQAHQPETWSEQHRHECEVRSVTAMAQADRAKYLGLVEARRGLKATAALAADLHGISQKTRRNLAYSLKNPQEGLKSAHSSVRDTGLDAYSSAKASGLLSKQQAHLLAFFQQRPGRDFTRQEVATGIDWGINVVCGRVKELIDCGILVEKPRRMCNETGQPAHPVTLK